MDECDCGGRGAIDDGEGGLCCCCCEEGGRVCARMSADEGKRAEKEESM